MRNVIKAEALYLDDVEKRLVVDEKWNQRTNSMLEKRSVREVPKECCKLE